MVVTRRFVLHLGEMFLAMVLGMAALDSVFEGILALTGPSYADMVDRAPTAVALILMFNMTVPMLAWMAIRGHEASEVSEMSVAMVVVGATTVFLLWLSVIDAAAICSVECGLMIPAMVAAMLLHPWLRARGFAEVSHAVGPTTPPSWTAVHHDARGVTNDVCGGLALNPCHM